MRDFWVRIHFPFFFAGAFLGATSESPCTLSDSFCSFDTKSASSFDSRRFNRVGRFLGPLSTLTFAVSQDHPITPWTSVPASPWLSCPSEPWRPSWPSPIALLLKASWPTHCRLWPQVFAGVLLEVDPLFCAAPFALMLSGLAVHVKILLDMLSGFSMILLLGPPATSGPSKVLKLCIPAAVRQAGAQHSWFLDCWACCGQRPGISTTAIRRRSTPALTPQNAN